MCDYLNSPLFKQYSSSSDEITLYYQLLKHSNQILKNCNLFSHEKEFGSNVNKQKFKGLITISKHSTLHDLKIEIGKKTGFPINTMVMFGCWIGEYYENGKKWERINNYFVDENTLILDSHYNNSIITNRYLYIFIDISINEIFSGINENQKINDKKLEKLEENEKESKKKISNLEFMMGNLTSENIRNKNIISNMTNKNKRLTEDLNKMKEDKEKEKKDSKDCDDKFKIEKNKIKGEMIEEWRKEINKILIKDYIDEFEIKGGKQKTSTITMIKSFENFTNEFIKQSENYINSFKENSKTIIEQFDSNKTNNSIEHINFIVIGPAGVGKSSFINQSLLLDRNNRALDGIGESITNKSHLYTSNKLTMIRMWDTCGIDFKKNPKVVLDEIKNLVNDGLKKGPDSFINIILYCTNAGSSRFQEEEGQLIKAIMELYPSDNLPVIITQLQAYFKEDAKKMEEEIRRILSKYLEEHIVNKIEIKSIVAKRKENINPYGIPELLKCSIDKMGKAITSATSKKFSGEIEDMCEEFVEKKLSSINNIFKDEFELLEYSKSLSNFNGDDDDEIQPKNNRRYISLLSTVNQYKMPLEYDFVNNFLKILNYKFKKVYNELNGYANIGHEHPYIFTFIEETLKKIQNLLKDFSFKTFQKLYKSKNKDYFHELSMKQWNLNKIYNTNNQINDASEIEKEFKKELFGYFNNEFFKIYLCIIIKLFKDNLQKILEENFKKTIKENEKKISQKAEAALKNVTEGLKQKLLKEINIYYPKEKEESTNSRILPNSSELSNESFKDDDNFQFDF